MKTLLSIITVCLSINLYSQINLVVNPSFENVSSIPQLYGEIYKAIGWKSPNAEHPNLISTLALQPYVSAPLGN